MKRDRPRRLPPGFSNRDYEFEPVPPRTKKPKYTREEKLAYQSRQKYASILRRFEREENAYLRRQGRRIAAEVKRDQLWLKQEELRERRLAKTEKQLSEIANWFIEQNKLEEAQRDQARRDRAKKLLDEINADTVKHERELLAS